MIIYIRETYSNSAYKIDRSFFVCVNFKHQTLWITCVFSARLPYVNITSIFIDDFRKFRCRQALQFVLYLLYAAAKPLIEFCFSFSKQRSIYLMQFCLSLNCPLTERASFTFCVVSQQHAVKKYRFQIPGTCKLLPNSCWVNWRLQNKIIFAFPLLFLWAGIAQVV
jgi:hypothetical protein